MAQKMCSSAEHVTSKENDQCGEEVWQNESFGNGFHDDSEEKPPIYKKKTWKDVILKCGVRSALMNIKCVVRYTLIKRNKAIRWNKIVIEMPSTLEDFETDKVTKAINEK